MLLYPFGLGVQDESRLDPQNEPPMLLISCFLFGPRRSQFPETFVNIGGPRGIRRAPLEHRWSTPRARIPETPKPQNPMQLYEKNYFVNLLHHTGTQVDVLEKACAEFLRAEILSFFGTVNCYQILPYSLALFIAKLAVLLCTFDELR